MCTKAYVFTSLFIDQLSWKNQAYILVMGYCILVPQKSDLFAKPDRSLDIGRD